MVSDNKMTFALSSTTKASMNEREGHILLPAQRQPCEVFRVGIDFYRVTV